MAACIEAADGSIGYFKTIRKPVGLRSSLDTSADDSTVAARLKIKICEGGIVADGELVPAADGSSLDLLKAFVGITHVAPHGIPGNTERLSDGTDFLPIAYSKTDFLCCST